MKPRRQVALSASAPPAAAGAGANAHGGAAAAAHTMLISSHQEALFENFNMQGVVALPHTQQFLLFGQNRNQAYAGRQPEHKFNGRLEVRTKDAKHIVASRQTPTSMVWYTSALPRDGQDPQLLVALQDNDNSNDQNNRDIIQTQIVKVAPAGLEVTSFLQRAGLQAYPSWLPSIVFQPPPNVDTHHVPNDAYITLNTWRISLAKHRVELRARKGVIASRPICTSSQYIAYSPPNERADSHRYAILGELLGGKAGIIRIPRRKAPTHTADAPSLTTLGISSANFRSAAWFNHSHYVVSCNDKQLVFGCADYPNIRVCVAFQNVTNVMHALATVPNEPIVIASEVDGSLNVYDVEPQLNRLKQLCREPTLPLPAAAVQQCFAAADTKHTGESEATPTARAAAGAAAASVVAHGMWKADQHPLQVVACDARRLTQLIPPKSKNWWARIWRQQPAVLADLAALHDSNTHTTTLLQHEREPHSQQLNVFNLRNNLLQIISEHLTMATTTNTKDLLLPALRNLIVAYLATDCFAINDAAPPPSPAAAQPDKTNQPKL